MLRLSLVLCLLCAACALDGKSHYNLFNPTPDGQLRPFSTDAAPRLQAGQP